MIPVEVSSPKLLQQVRWAVRVRHYSPRTEESYVAWVKRYARFHARPGLRRAIRTIGFHRSFVAD